jgi:hypothetical protein
VGGTSTLPVRTATSAPSPVRVLIAEDRSLTAGQPA